MQAKRKIGILAALAAVALYRIPSLFPTGTPTPVTLPQAGLLELAQPESAPHTKPRNEEWRPSIGRKDKAGGDSEIDATLHLDLLSRVLASKLAGGYRNLFDFVTPRTASKPDERKRAVEKASVTFQPPQPTPLLTAAAAVAAQYYGFAVPTSSGRRRGFFIDGEDIFIRAEGEMLSRSMKIVKLDARLATVIDLSNHRVMTLPIAEDGAG